MITPVRHRETEQSFYFLIPLKLGTIVSGDCKRITYNTKRYRVRTYTGEATKSQRENVIDAWAWFEKEEAYINRKMLEGAITVTISHEHPLYYWGGIEGND